MTHLALSQIIIFSTLYPLTAFLTVWLGVSLSLVSGGVICFSYS